METHYLKEKIQNLNDLKQIYKDTKAPVLRRFGETDDRSEELI